VAMSTVMRLYAVKPKHWYLHLVGESEVRLGQFGAKSTAD